MRNLRQLAKNDAVLGYALLAVASAWSLFRIWRSLQILFEVSHDGFMYYALWFVMSHRDMADIALQQSLYLPHTWLFLSPLFIFGWPVAKVLLLLLNLGAIGVIWWRLCQIAGLKGIRRWLLLVFFTSWLSTGLVIGLGNLVLICLAAMVAAYPFRSLGNAGALTLSAMKHSIVFPVYLQLMLRKPRVLVLPFAVFGVCGIAAMIWARLTPLETIAMAKEAVAGVGTWTQHDHTTLRLLFSQFISSPAVVSLANWGIWAALFAAAFRYIKDPLLNLAAMMLLSLLPLYHNIYDMVVAAPMLAVLLQRGSLLWPAAMSLTLATNLVSPAAKAMNIEPFHKLLEIVEKGYYPLLTLGFLGVLFALERTRRPERNEETENQRKQETETRRDEDTETPLRVPAGPP